MPVKDDEVIARALRFIGGTPNTNAKTESHATDADSALLDWASKLVGPQEKPEPDDDILRRAAEYGAKLNTAIESGSLEGYKPNLPVSVFDLPPEERKAYEAQRTQERVKQIEAEMPLPSFLMQAGASLDSVIQRLTGNSDKADQSNRFAQELEQATAARDDDGVLPAWLNRGVRSAAGSVTRMAPMIGTGPLGVAGMIGSAATERGNQALTEATDAGLTGGERLGYAGRAAAIEGGVTALFQKLGLGGAENLVAGKQVAKTVLGTLAKSTGAELAEEEAITVLDSINQQLSKVDPNALQVLNEKGELGLMPDGKLPPFLQNIADTAVATTLMTWAANVPNVVQSALQAREKSKQGAAQKLAEYQEKFRGWRDRRETVQRPGTPEPVQPSTDILSVAQSEVASPSAQPSHDTNVSPDSQALPPEVAALSDAELKDYLADHGIKRSIKLRTRADLEREARQVLANERQQTETEAPPLATQPANPAIAAAEVAGPTTGQTDKQPWQMTRDEYREWAAENHASAGIRRSAKSQKATEQGSAQAIDVSTVRANDVLQASLRGETIPPEVLADYPDLQKPKRQIGKRSAAKPVYVTPPGPESSPPAVAPNSEQPGTPAPQTGVGAEKIPAQARQTLRKNDPGNTREKSRQATARNLFAPAFDPAKATLRKMGVPAEGEAATVANPSESEQAKPVRRLGDKVTPTEQAIAGKPQAGDSELSARREESRRASDEEDQTAEVAGQAGFGFGLGAAGGGERVRSDKIGGTPDAIKAPTHVEARMQSAHGVSPASTLDKIKAVLEDGWNKFTRAQEFLPNTAEFAFENEKFRLLKLIYPAANDLANRNLHEITDPLGPQQFQLFSRKVIIDNLLASVERGEPVRFGFNLDDAGNELGRDAAAQQIRDYRDKLEKLVSGTPEVQEALRRRGDVVRDIVHQAVDLEILPRESLDRAESYYHQQVLSFFEASHRRGGTKPRLVKKGFQRQRVEGVDAFGESLDYNTSYLEAESTWMTEALQANAHKKWLLNLDAKRGILSELKEEAKQRGLNSWEDALKDHPSYSAWQPEAGNLFYSAFGLADRVAETILQGVSGEISDSDLRRLVALGGKKASFVLPTPVVRQLEKMQKPKPPGVWGMLADKAMAAWKAYTLLNPKRALGYTLRNITGDVDAALGGVPGVFGFTGQAMRELHNYYRDRLSVSDDLNRAVSLGVVSASMTSQDLPSLKDMHVFRRFYQKPEGASKLFRDFVLGEKIRSFNEFREGVLRYASYLYFKKALQDGTLRSFGGAKEGVVQAVEREMGVDEAAAHLSRNLLGDYGNLTVFGDWMRHRVFPFWSWQEINLKRYPRFALNAFSLVTKEGLSPTQRTVLGTAAFANIFLFTGATFLWNYLMFDEEEDELSEEEKANPHIIVGRVPGVGIVLLRNTGALGDFLDWFGIPILLRDLPHYANDQESLSDMTWEMAKQPLNKLVHGVRPDIKTPAELLAGQSSFPDVTNWRPMDRGEIAASPLGLGDEYKAVRGLLTGDGTRAQPGYVPRLLGVSDPRINALGEIYDLREKFLESKGKTQPKIASTSKYKTMRDAAFNDDYSAFIDSRNHYRANGGTLERFVGFLDDLDPIASRLKQADEIEFEQKFLTRRQRETLKVVRDFAGENRVKLWVWWKSATEQDKNPKESMMEVRRESHKLLERMPRQPPGRRLGESTVDYQNRLSEFVSGRGRAVQLLKAK